MSISQPPFQSTLVDANDRVQTPWAQWFSQLQPILQSVVASGPTSGRPTQNLYIGYPYFDTTIDQMVYWNGVIWVTYAPSTTGISILKGNGSGGFNNAVAGVDFAPATSGNAILYGDGTGGFSSVAIGSGVTFAGGVLSATGSGGTVTAVTGTAPIASSGGTTPAISISQAGVSTNGYLSSTDWNTFNNKGSGTVTSVTGSGNIASSGGTTPNITFTGTLPIANGGTNGTATPTAGAVAVGNGTQYAFTAAGSAGQVLTSNGSTVPTWATVATGIGTTGYWGSFWDTTNQTAASTTVAYTINIGTSDPNNNGVSIVSSNQITVAHAGVYNIQYSIQFQNIGTGNKNYNVDVWFRLNGVDISDSNSIYWIASKNSTVNGEMIAAVNYVMSLNAGDYIQILWAVSDVDISIATLPAASSPTVPRTPGVIVTVTPITEVGIGYYNLTSVSSVAIATGSKTFTTNLSNISTAFTVGTRVRVAYVTTPANFMEGVITSFSGTTLVVNVDSIGGLGTYANWTISVAGIQGSNGVTSITGTASQITASASTGAVTLSLPSSINVNALTATTANALNTANAYLVTGMESYNIDAAGFAYRIAASSTGTQGILQWVNYARNAQWTSLIGTNGNLQCTTSLSATSFSGPLTGNVTGNVSGTAGSLTNALTIGTGLSGASYNGSSAITIANAGVLSFTGGTTGLTPATATTGAVSLAGTLAVGNGGTGITTTPANGQVPIGNGSNYTAATLTAGTNIAVTNGSGSIIIATSIPVPTITIYASGSGTYTTPANTKYITVEMVGGGGGGGGSGTSPASGTGGTGGTTTFGTALLSCAGGYGGAYGGYAAGGSPSGGSANGISVNGGAGAAPGYTQSLAYVSGGMGGSSALGGAGGGSWLGNPGGNAAANTGGGGGGAGANAIAVYPNGGGAAAAYIFTTITSPLATYSYAVGAGGTAGAATTSGYAGGVGGSGYIKVTAYF